MTGFHEARRQILDCLAEGRIGHWPREDAFRKNWLDATRITPAELRATEMKIWKEEDESKAICPTCECRRDVVFRRRTVVRSEPDVEVPDVLVGVCRACDGIAVIPDQSTAKIRGEVERPRQILNVRLPGHLTDVLTLLVDRWARGARSGSASVVRTLLHRFGDDPAFAHRVKERLQDPLAEGSANRDLSVRVPSHIVIAVDEMAERVGIPTRSDVVRAVLVAAKEDVLDERDPDLSRALERALAAVP